MCSLHKCKQTYKHRSELCTEPCTMYRTRLFSHLNIFGLNFGTELRLQATLQQMSFFKIIFTFSKCGLLMNSTGSSVQHSWFHSTFLPEPYAISSGTKSARLFCCLYEICNIQMPFSFGHCYTRKNDKYKFLKLNLTSISIL